MSEADDLRKIISKKREAVTRKIARNRREKSIAISGTTYDPRISHTELKSFTRSELAQVLHTYNEFLSRENQFVEGKKNAPIPRHEWQPLQARIAALANKAAGFEQVIGGIRLPETNDTISHAQGMKARRENANQSFSPYPVFKRDSTDFANVEAIRAFEKNVSQRNIDTWEEESISSSRQHLQKIQEGMGESNEEYEKLSDFQFMVLWSTPNFLNDKGLTYEVYKAQNDENAKQRYKASEEKTARNESNRISKWATSLPKTQEEYEANLRQQDYAEAVKENRIRNQKRRRR